MVYPSNESRSVQGPGSDSSSAHNSEVLLASSLSLKILNELLILSSSQVEPRRTEEPPTEVYPDRALEQSRLAPMVVESRERHKHVPGMMVYQTQVQAAPVMFVDRKVQHASSMQQQLVMKPKALEPVPCSVLTSFLSGIHSARLHSSDTTGVSALPSYLVS